MAGVVVVGAGMAGAQTAITLRQHGYQQPITLIGDEPSLPYQRPPLSKAFLKGDADDASILIRPESFYAERDIDLRMGASVTAIDRDARTVRLADDEALPYEHLVLATGARNRNLPSAPGTLELRTLADAEAIRAVLRSGLRLIVIGGGFIGLELASSARVLGVEVVVVEALERLMARGASPELASYLQDKAETAGVDVRLATRVLAIDHGGVELEQGRIDADQIVVGIGVVPNTELASAAGLEVEDGIVVDELLRSSDPAISAIGDCARHPDPISGRALRLESVQNATDHARCVAARIAGKGEAPYDAVPWFWTEQHGVRVQMAGVAEEGAASVVRGEPSEDAFSVCRFDARGLVAVESVNHAADHMAARRLLGSGIAARVTPAHVEDPDKPLKELVAELDGGAG